MLTVRREAHARAGPSVRRPTKSGGVSCADTHARGFEADRGGDHEGERVDVVGARRRTPHRAPVQAGRACAAGMSGFQHADHRLRVDALSPHDRRPDRFIAGPQTAGVGDRDDRPPRQLTREDHGAVGRREHTLAGCARQVDTAMPGRPVRLGRVESPGHLWARPQRPGQPGAFGRDGSRPDQPGHQRDASQRDQSHHPSSAGAARLAPEGDPHLWTAGSAWKKHPCAGCKLLTAARLRGLTSRVCTRDPFH
ncbi:Uncharacterised protein [Mycolicibacterium flavescens]|nr:Uncharacterised protein [Mycolicibacterium flavescens]